MKRICLYGASEHLGGTEIYLITMVRALKDKITFDFLVHHDYDKIPFEEEIEAYGGKVYREYYKNSERKLPEYISPEKILSIHSEWDGIYLNLQSMDTSYRLLLAAKKRKLSYRIIHSHSCNYMNPIGLKEKIFEYFYKITKRFYVTNYLACSNAAAKWMFGKRINATVIPNSVDFNKFRMNDLVRTKMRNKYHILNDEIVIGFCGRLDSLKRPDFLIDILSELNENGKYKLLFVGEGSLKEPMVNKAKELNLLESIIFVGSVNNTEEYYQMMDCFVLPSRFEGFGIVLLEAQAAGLKCYTTKNVVPYETNVTKRVTFISQDLSAKEWADTIQKNGFDRMDCHEILEKSDYSINVLKQKILDVLKDE